LEHKKSGEKEQQCGHADDITMLHENKRKKNYRRNFERKSNTERRAIKLDCSPRTKKSDANRRVSEEWLCISRKAKEQEGRREKNNCPERQNKRLPFIRDTG
jgi:hypothetical protein